ncbi:MAG: hypothetical protein O6949_11020 [Chloroflexi bacterium]|nr:hypothetical protein [Chloroflexota bacterium]
MQLERHAAVNCAIERFIVEGDRRFTSRDQAVKSGPVDEPLEMCCRRLEPYPAPWEIESKQDLTKSFVGKVLRRVLVEDRA